jgi:hypothetical protein
VAISIQGIVPEVAQIIQDRTLERMFHDSLFPELLYRSEAEHSLWKANTGEVLIFTKKGLLPVSLTPLTPLTDPIPQTYNVEQWQAEAHQYGTALDTHMPTSNVTLASKVIEDTQQLGLNAGQTLNTLVRDKLYQAYLGGNTTAIDTAAIGATQIHVSSLNGFLQVNSGGTIVPVSPAAPIAVTFPSAATTDNTVVGATPDVAANPLGAGIIFLSAAIAGANVTTRHSVLATNRSVIHRVGGTTSVDGITGTDIVTLTDIIDAVQVLTTNNVPRHADGLYHCHLNPQAVAQLYRDADWVQLHEGLPDSLAYKELVIGKKAKCLHYENTENPNSTNVGTVANGLLYSTGAGSSVGSAQLGGEITNNAGINIGRCIITGRGAIYEKYLDESGFLSEAGVTGKIKPFQVVNNGAAILTERIRLILRSPQDRLQQVISQAWSWSGDFPIPSDVLTGSNARFKRAIVIEHAT